MTTPFGRSPEVFAVNFVQPGGSISTVSKMIRLTAPFAPCACFPATSRLRRLLLLRRRAMIVRFCLFDQHPADGGAFDFLQLGQLEPQRRADIVLFDLSPRVG